MDHIRFLVQLRGRDLRTQPPKRLRTAPCNRLIVGDTNNEPI